MADGQAKRWENAGLTSEEYRMIEDVLGREPERSGVSTVFCHVVGTPRVQVLPSAAQKLPTSGSQVLQGPGENAGLSIFKTDRQ